MTNDTLLIPPSRVNRYESRTIQSNSKRVRDPATCPEPFSIGKTLSRDREHGCHKSNKNIRIPTARLILFPAPHFRM